MAKISVTNSKKHVSHELELLVQLCQRELRVEYDQQPLYQQLKQVNHELWGICEQRRQLDSLNDFGPEYIELSKSEYKTNDQRAMIKSQINTELGSGIFEVKSYSWFQKT